MDAFTAFFLVVGVGFFAHASLEARSWKRWALGALSLACAMLLALCLWATYLDVERQIIARYSQSTLQVGWCKKPNQSLWQSVRCVRRLADG